MKKIICIFAFALLMSCDKDEAVTTPVVKSCNCVKQTWIRQINPTITQWYFNGSTEPYSINCADDGKIVGGYSGQGLEFQYRVKCN